MPVQSGIVQLLWEAGTAVVYTCSLDGIVRLWDARTGRLLTDYRGHTAEILDFALSKYVNWTRAGVSVFGGWKEHVGGPEGPGGVGGDS